MKFIKNNKILILICIISFLFFMYPFIANYWNSNHSSKIIYDYENIINKYDEKEAEKLLNEAKEYNKSLLERDYPFSLTDEQKLKYDSILNIDNGGNIGYITIDAINVNIPIYHGISDFVLKNNVGHLEWSSFPIGGVSTHSVLSAHSGLVDSRLFTDLNELKIGDKFTIHVLNERLVYEIDQIKTVEPDNQDDLSIEEGKDLVTLTTCTPYGINTHRLLVRGHRIEDNKEFASFSPNGIFINKYIEASILSIIPLCIFIIITIIKSKTRKEDVL